VIETDLDTGQDFFALQPRPGYPLDVICSNPPFGPRGRTLIRFISHALEIMPNGWVIMLCPWTFPACDGEADGRRALLDHPRRYAMTEPRFRPRWFEGTTIQPMHAFCWNVWKPGYMVQWSDPVVALWR
jgi:hypothetical protein